MEAPDKIYLNFPKIQPKLDNATFDTKQYDDCINVEYIRKDALLKWLESKVYEHNEDRFDDGFNTALGQVIDKLNSL